MNYMLYIDDVTCNVSGWSDGGNDIYKKTFWKNSLLK